MDGPRIDALDMWTDYCVKSDELALLILESHRHFNVEIQNRITRKREQLNDILDTMIGGVCRTPVESGTTGKLASVRDA